MSAETPRRASALIRERADAAGHWDMHDAHPPITTTAEGGGHVVTCGDCQWTRFLATYGDALAAVADHAKKCKGPKVEKAKPAPRATSSGKWDDREGATWIDQL